MSDQTPAPLVDAYGAAAAAFIETGLLTDALDAAFATLSHEATCPECGPHEALVDALVEVVGGVVIDEQPTGPVGHDEPITLADAIPWAPLEIAGEVAAWIGSHQVARERITATLAEHRWEFYPDESDSRNVRFDYVVPGLWRCGCGWRVPEEEFNPEAHERHLADVLTGGED